MSRLRRYRPSGSMLVALLAFVIATTGSAVAASLITSAQIKDGTIQTKDISKKAQTALKGKRGAAGARGLQGSKGDTGPKGDQGLTGDAGPRGDQGAKGDTGAQGDPGPLLQTLPAGKTLKGDYHIGMTTTAASQFVYSGITFQFPLPTAPTFNFIPQGGPATANCPGSVADPQAAAGFLCLYEGASQNKGPGQQPQVCSSAGGCGSPNSPDKFGVGLELASAAAGFASSSGTWAVTAS
jgi:hypothetical protein